MLKKTFSLLLMCLWFPLPLLAQNLSDQEYINKLAYQRNRLELVTKERKIDVKSSYSYTDIESYAYSFEAYSQTSADISTQSLSKAEVQEIKEWYIYKGGIRELSDIAFLQLVGDGQKLDWVLTKEYDKARMRTIGNLFIGTGLLALIGGAGLSAGQPVVTAGALTMVSGFFISAFNLSPQHFIQPDYAQEKIDEYNIDLKRRLNLPIDY